MNKQRLEALAAQLEVFVPSPALHFDIETWYAEGGGCGTAACAAGIACLMVEFNAQGLSLKSGKLTDNLFHSKFPVFENYLGWDAIVKFFGFPENGPPFRRQQPAIFYIFDPECYERVQDDPESRYKSVATPKMVAARIREVLAGKFQ